MLGLLLLAAAFAAGVALGTALYDNPDTSRRQTYVRTLKPLTLTAEPETVTVTVERP